MASWWRLIAQGLGATGSGSWKRIVAANQSAQSQSGSNWARKLVEQLGSQRSGDNWDRQLSISSGTGPWARQIYLSGLPSQNPSYVLREDGSFVLREDGSKILREH